MKRIAYYIMPLFAVVVLATACDDEDYRNPSGIVNSYVDEHQNLLISSEYGWRFDYSPNEDKYGVYTFLMDFKENGRVTMQTDMDFFYQSASGEDLQRDYEPQESDYTIQNVEGPVLTFATYSLLTKLADPELNVAGSGWNGDNDFIIMGHSVTNDTIYLKSLKAQKKCFLVKNTEDWDSYFEGMNKVIEKFAAVTAVNTYFRDIEIEGCEPAVMAEFNMATRMGVVYQNVNGQMVADTCRFRFTSNEVRLEEPLLIGNVEVTHFTNRDDIDGFLVNGKEGSTINVVTDGRPKMIFDVRDKVFKGVFEEVIDGVSIERDDMYQFFLHPEESNDEWAALSLKINKDDYQYMLVVPDDKKNYYFALYVMLSDDKGQRHYVLAQCQVNYTWIADDEVRFQGAKPNTLLFAGMDTEDGEWKIGTPLAKKFQEAVETEFMNYLGSMLGVSERYPDRVECVVVPSIDGYYFNFVNKKTGGLLQLMKAY